MLSAKQGGIKYYILSLWYDSTWDWTPVCLTIGKHSTHYANGLGGVGVISLLLTNKWSQEKRWIITKWNAINFAQGLKSGRRFYILWR